MTNKKSEVKIKNIENSQIEITCQIPYKNIEPYRKSVLEKLKANVTIPGFRKGKATDQMIVDHVGELNILEEMAQDAIVKDYMKVLDEQKIKAIGRPQIIITKIAKNTPIEYKAITAIYPEITLPDYKKIAKDINKKKQPVEVTKEETEEAINHLRRMRTQSELLKNKKESESTPKISDIEDKDLIELDDDYVKTLGDFKNVNDFKEKLKENIKQEKENKAIEKHRLDIIKAIIEKTKTNLPEILVESELNRMWQNLEFDITKNGLKIDDYLSSIKKTKEDIKKEWHEDAVFRVMMQLVLDQIKEKENINADENKAKEELEHMKKTYGEHKEFNELNAKMYINQILSNQAVFSYLETI